MSEEQMNHESVERVAPIARENVSFTTARDVERGVLYVGIDLGTSQTVISASNGARAVVESYVGYPRDDVSRKLLKKDILFGEEALENELSVDLFRPLEEGVIKYSDNPAGVSAEELEDNFEAVKALIHHVVSLAKPKETDLIYGVIGCPALANTQNQKSIIDAAREALDKVIIVSEPFAVAYGMEKLAGALVIDIGAGTTDLCRMKGTQPEDGDQLTLNFAGDFIDRELCKLLEQRCAGAQFSKEMVKEFKERFSFVTESAEPVFVTLPVSGEPVEFEITEEVRQACRGIIDPIVGAMKQLIGSFHPKFQAALRNNVVLAGGGSQIFGLDRALEDALQGLGGGRVTNVREPVYAGANGGLHLAQDAPEDFWENV
jgi:rod shape-determining protein MreB and related proteins